MFVSESLVPEKRGIVMLKRVFCSVVCFLASLLSLPYLEADVITYDSCYAWVRVNRNNVKLELSCTVVDYTGPHGATGCAGAKFDISVYTTAPTFPITIGGTTYTEAQHQAYWGWVYTGYTGGGYTDWSLNCHAYGFGGFDWPHHSNTIIASGSTQCWVQDFSNATIADNGGHTVKVRVQDCPLSVGLIIVESYEKFQESGIYTQTGGCSMPVDMGLGNEPRGDMTFSYYKKQ